VGAAAQRRFARHFAPEEMKILLVAGAAAGLSAIFKAPATGAVFAIEVPYRNDVASRAVLPALIASSASYLVFVAFRGVHPLFAVGGGPRLDAVDLVGAVAIGLVASAGARLFAAVVAAGEAVAARTRRSWPMRVAAAGLALGALAVLADAVLGSPLTLGPGYDVLTWATRADPGFWLVVFLFSARALATGVTIGGGGAGGTFIPLVVQGALLGKMVSFGFAARRATLFTLIGASAFVGAGYRTPLAGVTFVAESTGRPGFIVPGLIATVFAQLLMGSTSVARGQHERRAPRDVDD
jgi:CIC family chloride channel protein